MKIFLDCSDVELIRDAYETGLIDGVTTNPSLMLKAGKDPVGVLKEISSIFPFHSSVSAEVVGETTEEMLEMASYGAKMNPRSIELGMVFNVPILVSSSMNETSGTLIHEVNNMDMKVGEIRNRVRGIATEKDVAKIIVYSVVDRPGIASSLFEPLAQADISVDVIVQNSSVEGKTDLTFTVKQESHF